MQYRIERIKPFGVILKALDNSSKIKDISVEDLKEIFHKESLVVLRGFLTFEDAQSFADYCESWGEVSMWPFGKVLELVEHDRPEDHIFDNSYVPLHWDGMYREYIPEYQIFHCIKSPLKGEGGNTVFSNTSLVLENSKQRERNLWSKVNGSYKRKMEFYHSKTISPIITMHPYKSHKIIRYNEPHTDKSEKLINIPDLNFYGVEENKLSEFHHSLKKQLYCNKNSYSHKWCDDDVVIADNFTLLHGRKAFESRSLRHIRRVQVLSEIPYKNPSLENFNE